VLLLDTDRTVLALNQTLASVIGKEPQEIVGTCIDSYFNPDVMARRKEYTDSVVRSGKPVRFDSERAGRYFEHCAYPVFDDQGQVTRLAAFARDVTVQKQAQKELEAKSRYLEETNTALKVLLNRRELDRKELEDTVLSNVKKLILPVLHRLKDCRLGDEAHAFLVSNFECRLLRNDGTCHWVCISSHAACDGAGKVLYFEGHLQDITEGKLAEEQLILQRDLALELAKVSSLDEALSLTLHAVTQAIGCDCAGIYLRNSATGDLELASSAGLSEEFLKKAARVSARSDAWSFVNKAKEGPVYLSVHENMSMPYRGEALLAEGIRSVAVIPVLYEGGIIACFNAGSRGTDTIPASSRSTLELIGAQFGNIIARLQAEQELQEDLQKTQANGRNP
jgi:PAS domain-containing protein